MESVGFRLSPPQQRLLEHGNGRQVIQCAAVLRGSIGAAGIEGGLRTAITRHEILRSSFPRLAGLRGRSQVIHDAPAFEWTACQGEPFGDAGRLQPVLAAEAGRPFDLDHGPLVRALLIGAGEERGVLVVTVHAACADAASLVILLREALQGAAAQPPEPVQYADYAQWRHELIGGDGEAAGEGTAFWRAQAEDLPARAPILFEERGSAQTGDLAWRSVPVAIDPEKLERAAERSGVSTALLLEAAWHALLARTTGAGELMLCGWCDGRGQPDLHDAIGPYAQPVPIQTRVQRATTFAEILDQVRRARLQAAAWQDYASADDLDTAIANATAGYVHVGLESLPETGLELAALGAPAWVSPMLAARGEAAALRGELWRDPARHSSEDVAQLATGLSALLECIAENVARPVSELPLSDRAGRAQLLARAAGPGSGEDALTPVHELFARQAERERAAPAVADAAGELNYGELNAAANRLAALLRELGVGTGSTVGVCMERTTKLMAAVLAVMKAGAAYVPLNHEHPPARLAHQLSEARAGVVITEDHLLARLPELAGEVVCVDRDADRIESFPDEEPRHGCSPGDLAYVMYTSGSTGLPKGVAVTHANLANYSRSIVELLGAGDQGLRFGVVSAISTDLGNTCIFPPLICGGSVTLISPSASMDADVMKAELGSRRLDVLKVTPSHLRALISGGTADVLPRQWLLLGGEALSWDLVAQVRSLSAGCRIVNHYGPTETTIGCCAYEVGEPRTDSATVPIGRPLAGVRAYVLGAGDDLLPPGIPGELCIAGKGVSAGYLGRAGETAGAFGEDPFEAGRMYRTGDRARYLRDGAIEFLGRVDEQVKIRGFRIEPGEIESSLLRHPAVRQAAVVPEKDERGETRLVGYVATSAAPTVEELQRFLADSLPEYMIPSAFALLQSLPFTASGKVDRRALGDLAMAQTRRQAQYVAPRDEIESEIAEIWSELLGVERVGVFDEFFALGGHSLLATQAIMRIRRAHGDIPLGALLASPTVADLAEVVRSASAAAK